MKAEKASRSDLDIGFKIKHARLAQGLKLRELADKLGCSESFLSKVENHKVQPSLSMLHRIVSALETNIPYLFSDDAPLSSDPVYITRKDARKTITTGPRSNTASIAIERLVITTKTSLLEANIHVVEPGGYTDGVYAHKGEEAGYVIQGSLELQVEDRTYLLHEGDSFAFRSDLPHGYCNPGDVETRVLWVNTPPTF